jgi:hypothetical protein
LGFNVDFSVFGDGEDAAIAGDYEDCLIIDKLLY